MSAYPFKTVGANCSDGLDVEASDFYPPDAQSSYMPALIAAELNQSFAQSYSNTPSSLSPRSLYFNSSIHGSSAVRFPHRSDMMMESMILKFNREYRDPIHPPPSPRRVPSHLEMRLRQCVFPIIMIGNNRSSLSRLQWRPKERPINRRDHVCCASRRNER